MKNIKLASILITVGFIVSLCAGYYLKQQNPDGLYLYTQPVENTMHAQPAFPIGVFVGLFTCSVIAALVAIASLVIALFSNKPSEKLASSLKLSVFLSIVFGTSAFVSQI